jgi:2-polyprenyl-3-methyl-5-hydroxy-6-metoxy-1,4-benzoquinol methylase
MPGSSWQQMSSDPNSREVLAERARVLAATRRPPIDRRVPYLVELARGKRVLDIGIVEHFSEAQQNPNWLHGALAEVATTCVGVDILPDAVAHLRDLGYDARLHDVIASPLPEQFDLIVMGEVIEHVGAPETLLQHARQMLRPGGLLVVTTPNPYMMNRALHGLLGHARESADHVALFGPSQMFELAERAGLRIEHWRGVRLPQMRTPRGRLTSAARRVLAGALRAPEADCDPLVYELGPNS